MFIRVLILSMVSTLAVATEEPEDKQLSQCIQLEKKIAKLSSKRDRRLKGQIRSLKRESSNLQCFKRHTEVMKAVGFK